VPRAGFTLSLLMVTLFVGACSNVSFIEEITFSNETDYPAKVEVSGASRQGWLNLTIAQRDRETTVQEVIDQGDVWVFRFDYAGKHEEELEISRAELVRADWKVEVPQSFGDALRRLGVEPPP
jgi:hypothetical protein